MDSPDLASIVQEVVGQSGWQPGNNLALLISPALTGQEIVGWQAFDLSPFNAPHSPQLSDAAAHPHTNRDRRRPPNAHANHHAHADHYTTPTATPTPISCVG